MLHVLSFFRNKLNQKLTQRNVETSTSEETKGTEEEMDPDENEAMEIGNEAMEIGNEPVTTSPTCTVVNTTNDGDGVLASRMRSDLIEDSNNSSGDLRNKISSNKKSTTIKSRLG